MTNEEQQEVQVLDPEKVSPGIWISTSHALPLRHHKVLVCTAWGELTIGQRKLMERKTVRKYFWTCPNPTHWTPLPIPTKPQDKCTMEPNNELPAFENFWQNCASYYYAQYGNYLPATTETRVQAYELWVEGLPYDTVAEELYCQLNPLT